MNPRRISEQLVQLVQIIFGFVLAQSLGRYADIVIDPFSYEHRIAFMALLTVYFTTVMSWVDWHPTMEANPYNMSSRNPHRRTEVLRLWFDLLVVTFYAYLLFSVEAFKGNPQGDIGTHLYGYPLIFGMYLLSGLSRRRAYGRYASYLSSIVIFGLLFLALAVVYNTVDWERFDLESVSNLRLWANVVGLLLALSLMISYRVYRNRLRTRRRARKEDGLKVGFDVDGVLGDQVEGVLPRIQRRHGIELSHDEVTDWRLPIGNSSIDVEIVAAMDDPEYILRMPVHPEARGVLEKLFDENEILVLTARPSGTSEWTEQWLMNSALPYDKIFNVKEQKKSLYATDVLVDDYLGNVSEYLSNTDDGAVLVNQPWNQERPHLEDWIKEGRLHVVNGLSAALKIIEDERSNTRTRNR